MLAIVADKTLWAHEPTAPPAHLAAGNEWGKRAQCGSNTALTRQRKLRGKALHVNEIVVSASTAFKCNARA